MAATAVYTNIARVSSDAVPSDVQTFTNINATTSAFPLRGGKYGVTCKASTYGTVTLQVLAVDQATWLTALTAFAADGFASVDLPPGQFRIAVA
jgi:hypothetical protein